MRTSAGPDASSALPEHPRRTPALPVRSALFLVLFFFYVWLRVDPGLVYYAHMITADFPFFSRNAAFLADLLAYPGGVVEYVSAGLSQLYYYSWIGALIATAVAGLLSLTAWLLVRAVTGRPPRFLHFVPPVLVLVCCGRYAHLLTGCMAVLSATAAACLYVWLPVGVPSLRFAVFLVLSCVLYYVAGGAYLLYAVVCALFELFRWRRRVLGALCILAGAAVPYVIGRHVLLVRIADAYGRLLPFRGGRRWQTEVLIACLYLFYPVALLLTMVWRTLAARKRQARDSAQGRVAAGPSRGAAEGTRRWLLETVLVLAAAGAVGYLSFDGGPKALLAIERCSQRRMWPELLAHARRLPQRLYDPFVAWDVNRALYHTGRLRDEMFSYPQDGLSLRPPDPVAAPLDLSQTACMEYSDVLFDLGRVNESERAAYMALEYLGERPAILQRLALLSVARGEAEAARILLGALSQDLILAGWARRYLARLGKDPSLSADEEIGRLRSVMVTEDKVGTPPFEDLLLDLLRSNRHNRMAFEYLMAHYLLSRDLEGVARNIGRLDDFGHRDIPKHYEEAIVLHMAGTDSEVDLRGRSIRWETLSRFTEFCKMRDRHSGDRRRAWDALAKDYGDTYFFYYTFGSSGGTE